MTHPIRLLLLALSIIGCAAEEPGQSSSAESREPTPPADTPGPGPVESAGAAPGPHVAVGPGEVTLVLPEGQTRRFDFGTDLGQAIAAISAAAGEATLSEVIECGLDAATWENGLSVYAVDDELAGWYLGEPGVTTMSGVGVGSTLEDVSAAYAAERVPDSTLGIEYVAGEMALILDRGGSSGRVTDMWSGRTCVAR